MKFLRVATLAAVLSVSSANAVAGGKHLFILSGQSNMQLMDEEKSFVPAVKAAFGSAEVIVVKLAKKARSIRYWHKEYRYWPQIREAQVKLAESLERFAWIDTDDCNDGIRHGREIENGLHMSDEGYILQGRRMAAAAIELVRRDLASREE